MRAIMIMYDTLCRDFLSPYGNNWVQTPNFERLAKKAVTFDTNYVCSLPCMPARRDMHNGRVNFLQRDWGPLEPYDDSMPEELKNHGIYSCLVSDHYHYWEDGGCTYHNRYNSWIAHRGQEGDTCYGGRQMVELSGQLGSSFPNPHNRPRLQHTQDQVNRAQQRSEAEMPQAKTFADGIRFLKENRDTQNWFLQIETFDPHEPFFTQPEWKEKYPELANYHGKKSDWPGYDPVREGDTSEDIAYVRNLYAALISMCDAYLGQVLDVMDEYDMWNDTMLIVNTDHGFLLGEHDWWGKSIMPAYEEISHTPLFIYDPISKKSGERRETLTSTIDLPVTILDFFGVEIPNDMQGCSLLPVIREGKKVHDALLYGAHASHVAVTDGTYTYFRAPRAEQEKNCYDYTLMPTRMRERFSIADLQQAEFTGPFAYTKGCKVLKTPAKGIYVNPVNFGTKLFNVKRDPRQKHLIQDFELEAKMANLLVREMKKADSPKEQYERLGLPEDSEVTAQMVEESAEYERSVQTPDVLGDVAWSQEAINVWRVLGQMFPTEGLSGVIQIMKSMRMEHVGDCVTMSEIVAALKKMLPPEKLEHMLYFILTVSRAE